MHILPVTLLYLWNSLQVWQQRIFQLCGLQCVVWHLPVSLECRVRELESPVSVTGLSGQRKTTFVSITPASSTTLTLGPVLSITTISCTGERRRQLWKMVPLLFRYKSLPIRSHTCTQQYVKVWLIQYIAVLWCILHHVGHNCACVRVLYSYQRAEHKQKRVKSMLVGILNTNTYFDWCLVGRLGNAAHEYLALCSLGLHIMSDSHAQPTHYTN